MIIIYNENEIVGGIPENYIPLYPQMSLQIDNGGIVIANTTMFIKYIHCPENKKKKRKIKNLLMINEAEKLPTAFIPEEK
jgi:hypothetical protein